MRLLVTGSRTYPESGMGSWLLSSVLDGVWAESTIGYMTVDMYGFTIIEGGCPTGADAVARWWAENSPMHSYESFPEDVPNPLKCPNHPPFRHKRMNANWRRFGKGAGPLRNQAMVDYLMEGDINEERLVLGFVDKPLEESDGTFNCIQLAEAAKVPHFVVRYYK
jgi:hypothetical protein